MSWPETAVEPHDATFTEGLGDPILARLFAEASQTGSATRTGFTERGVYILTAVKRVTHVPSNYLRRTRRPKP